MTSIVGFLEGVGSSAVLRHATSGQLREFLEQAMIDPQAVAAILVGDRPALEAIAGCRVIAHKVVSPGKDDEDDDAPAHEDEEIRVPQAYVRATA